MFEMLVQRSNPGTPLTPVSTPPESHLSPRSSNSSFGSSDGLHNASLHSPNNDKSSPQEFSALQRLQYALARDSLFSTMLQNSEESDQRLVKPCHSSSSSSSLPNSPEDAREINSPLSPTRMTIQLPAESPNDSSTNIFQCPVHMCAMLCNSRHDFNEHLVTHSQHFGCPKCSFIGDDEIKLKDHIIEAHDAADLDVLTDEEVGTPKTNSQGKMKTFKCKQCGYQAVTKKDFWEHTKGHIRQEKMLTCPKCPFVTEYKHHLEYHLRNHFGSKPFQCTKCAYSCVNKSMLNSHLKSHSNIYQYRCADCAYATKYCHSLKLHLRKYDHKPSMVLNPDGTPNPLPIIDVYGTRRGPKIKRSEQQDQLDMGSTALSPVTPKDRSNGQKTPRRQNNKIADRQAVKHSPSGTPPVSPPSFTIGEAAQDFSVFSPQRKVSPPQSSSDEKPFNFKKELSSNFIMHQFPNTGIPQNMAINMTSVNPGLHALLLQQNNSANGSVNHATSALQNILMQNSVNLPGMSPMELYATALNQYIVANNHQSINPSSQLDLGKIAEEQRSRLITQLLQQSSLSHQNDTAPASHRTERAVPINEMNNDSHNALDLRNPRRSSDNNVTEAPLEDAKKRKRKGKALRYDRKKVDYEMNDNEVLDFSNNNYTTTNNNNNLGNSKVEVNDMDSDSETISCKYCDISFPPILYALHMRFHSSDVDPFRCNVCGIKSSDKVSFFVHLATASH